LNFLPPWSNILNHLLSNYSSYEKLRRENW